ncbi:MAG: hypothetical protein JNJ69_10165 [Leptospiraceae bacterium]|nr:hypothetical protein [Leptospiraceae bacterium]
MSHTNGNFTRKKIRTIFYATFTIGLALITQSLHSATQANFSVSAPPLPWFEFEKGQWDLRLAGNYTSVSGKESGTNKEVSVTGGGVSVVGRYAFNDYLAADFGYYFVGIGGGTTAPKTFNIALYMNTWNPNLEVQVIRNERVSWILFAGALWSFTPGELTTYSTSGVATGSYGFNIYLSGPQFGTQLSIKAADFAFSPFVLIQSLSGNFYVYYPSSTASVPAFTMTSFGIDVTYVPWNITLSSVINQASAAAQNSGYDTLYLALSYDFRWGVAPKAEVTPPAEEPPPPPKRQPKAKAKR